MKIDVWVPDVMGILVPLMFGRSDAMLWSFNRYLYAIV